MMTFHNQNDALTKIEYSHGKLVVLDAITGFGKTAILEKLQEDYKAKEWFTAYVSLKSNIRDFYGVDERTIFLLTIEALRKTDCVEIKLNPKVDLIFSIPKDRPVALFYDDVHFVWSLDWIKSEFAPLVMQGLQERTNGQFLLIFAGQHLLQKSLTWNHSSYNFRRVFLEPFKTETVQDLVELLPHEVLRNLTNSDKEWLVSRLVQMSGGHPRILFCLFNELETGSWMPLKNLTNDEDKNIFRKHVLGELEKLSLEWARELKGLPSLMTELSIFRNVDLTTIDTVQRDLSIHASESAFSILGKMRKMNLIASGRMSSVIRSVLLANLFFEDEERYKSCHYRAKGKYDELIGESVTRNVPLDELEKQIVESFYHLLSYLFDAHNTEREIRITQALQIYINKFGQLIEKNRLADINVEEKIMEIISTDADLIAMIRDYKLDIFALPYQIKNSNELPARSDDSHLRIIEQCKNNTAAICHYNGSVAGTGFWISHNHRLLLVTCAHVIHEIIQAGSEMENDRQKWIKVRLFSPAVNGDLYANLLWPSTLENNLKPTEDIAILEIETDLTKIIKPFPIDIESFNVTNYQTIPSFYSFGYPNYNPIYGEEYKSLKMIGLRGQGVVELENSGGMEIEKGVSGAPLLYIEGEKIVGMIQAKQGSRRIYFIPSLYINAILSTFDNLT